MTMGRETITLLLGQAANCGIDRTLIQPWGNAEVSLGVLGLVSR
jgi:hypothetical protein